MGGGIWAPPGIAAEGAVEPGKNGLGVGFWVPIGTTPLGGVGGGVGTGCGGSGVGVGLGGTGMGLGSGGTGMGSGLGSVVPPVMEPEIDPDTRSATCGTAKTSVTDGWSTAKAWVASGAGCWSYWRIVVVSLAQSPITGGEAFWSRANGSSPSNG